jgi:hypothetical protein
MAFKSMVGASMLLAVCVALTGCQNPPKRQAINPGFSQRQGSTNPPQLGNPQSAQSSGLGTPTSTAGPGGLGGGIPTSPPTTNPPSPGNQFRTTSGSPGFINQSGPGSQPGTALGSVGGPTGFNGPTSFGGPTGFGSPTPPSLGPGAGVPASFPPITPPPNPSAPATTP